MHALLTIGTESMAHIVHFRYGGDGCVYCSCRVWGEGVYTVHFEYREKSPFTIHLRYGEHGACRMHYKYGEEGI